MTSTHNPNHLPPSELGTKEYWNTLYTRELTNHASDPSDTGTVWFDDADAEAKMVAFLNDVASSSQKGLLSKEDASLLDLGCGNGSMLFALREDGWTGRALGVDYSPQSVRLARQVGRGAAVPVDFAEWDIVSGPYEAVMPSGPWDVVLDKGTFDAVSLSEEKVTGGGGGGGGDDARRLCEVYPERVLRLVRRGGLFLITSCNWTEEELTRWFVRHVGETEEGFVVAGTVEHRSFSFGGVKGQTISTICFRKV